MTTLAGFDTRLLFCALVGLVVVQRLAELLLAERNRRRILARGGVEVGAGHYRWMVLLHTAFLVAAPLEVWGLGRPFLPYLAAAMLGLLLVAMVLRYWAISTLGERWTTRILCLPEEAVVTGGPYRWLRHPNYLAVILEILALPLVHAAILTALVFSLANAWMLSVRIREEETALSRHSNYQGRLGATPRWLPGADGIRRRNDRA